MTTLNRAMTRRKPMRNVELETIIEAHGTMNMVNEILRYLCLNQTESDEVLLHGIRELCKDTATTLKARHVPGPQ